MYCKESNQTIKKKKRKNLMLRFFPFYHPLDGKRTISDACTAIENKTFGAYLTKSKCIQMQYKIMNRLQPMMYLFK